ncbi:hypothetical protein TTHERM_000037279 (macronuclear) [Tetrahymena thermophila SB210]|uniref:Uncharacterized protein n=1 Tax=Tetrahymena thermophila (strain SB210) TaxID=312017 RepID=W7X697_TETTS|nr:hypothetical protein TTHERM_000037279 [Tetrahymena thermophila SB210]EWS74890.1 hypothetical protein TTHERM_000037279 [Tetrahymena thermophila SB210]|eukprot:XP_012652603.1 hypothetical protein TTHERM_000037279 [Tetrahymena thermophila SB210]
MTIYDSEFLMLSRYLTIYINQITKFNFGDMHWMINDELVQSKSTHTITLRGIIALLLRLKQTLKQLCPSLYS